MGGPSQNRKTEIIPGDPANTGQQGRAERARWDLERVPEKGFIMGEKAGALTIRQRMIALLHEKEMTARDLSQALGIREREVFDHLSHIARTVAAQGGKLEVLPIVCLACGWVFQERKRFTRPSRCPRCKKSHLETPAYRLSLSPKVL
jgi:transcriptional regulator